MLVIRNNNIMMLLLLLTKVISRKCQTQNFFNKVILLNYIDYIRNFEKPTTYPRNFPHSLCFVLLCCGLISVHFTWQCVKLRCQFTQNQHFPLWLIHGVGQNKRRYLIPNTHSFITFEIWDNKTLVILEMCCQVHNHISTYSALNNLN